jgi:hypothetical protein
MEGVKLEMGRAARRLWQSSGLEVKGFSPGTLGIEPHVSHLRSDRPWELLNME